MLRLFYVSSVSFALVLVVCLTGCGQSAGINSPEDVAGRYIGALSGTPSIQLANEWGTAVPFDNAADMMRELRAGNIDCVVMERTTAVEIASNTSGVRILSEPLSEYELRFAIPLENTGLLNAVNFALEELGRNNTLRGITNKYFARGNFVYVEPDDVEPRDGELIIALPSDSPPFSFRATDGMFIGMDVEVAIAVTDFLGVTLRIVEYDVWDLVTAVWHGRVDMALGWHPGEDEGRVNTSEPYARAVHSVIVRR